MVRDGAGKAQLKLILKCDVQGSVEAIKKAVLAITSDKVECSFSKIFFLISFLGGDRKKADEMGVRITAADWAVFTACSLFIGARKALYALGSSIPGLRKATDRMLVKKIERMLESYGHPAHASDATQYRPAVAT